MLLALETTFTSGDLAMRPEFVGQSYVSGGEARFWTGFGFQSSNRLPHSAAEETAGIVASPELVQAIAEGREASARGDVLTSEELDRLLASRER
jgi:hypothetical protein